MCRYVEVAIDRSSHAGGFTTAFVNDVEVALYSSARSNISVTASKYSSWEIVGDADN